MNASNPEPVVGWRLWQLRKSELRSWALDYVWQPGENQAVCLSKEPSRCLRSPGIGCKCGFWALRSPAAAMRLAAANPSGRPLMGLIRGFGTVALHGKEGYRAELATVICLFADELDTAPQEPIWGSVRRWFRSSPENQIRESNLRCPDDLRALADHYGVPMLFLHSALAVGLLGELGVAREAIVEVETWNARTP